MSPINSKVTGMFFGLIIQKPANMRMFLFGSDVVYQCPIRIYLGQKNQHINNNNLEVSHLKTNLTTVL